MRLRFLGANRQVTGSRYLLEAGGCRVVIDCGLFQERRWLGRNWEDPPFDPASADFLLLTHAHLDHTGLVPRLVAAGFDRPIICTEPTAHLAEIVMLDSAKIHQEDAAYKQKRHRKEKRRGAHPEVPLYTTEDAQKTLPLLQAVRFDESVKLSDRLSATFHEAGHILGSAIIELRASEDGRTRRLIFSGDVGQWNKPLIRDPSLLDGAEYVVLESTYGDRNHRDAGDPEDQLADIINDTARRGGNVVIPTFAIERAQELVYHIGRLVHKDRIPDLPVYLDSPMAVDVTEVFRDLRDYMDDQCHRLFAEGTPPLRFPGLKLVRAVEESKAINTARSPSVIMSSSGMCTGGRIKHHLKANISRGDSTILFVGYQGQGTLGRLILNGSPKVRIHRRQHTVRARIAQIHGFSAHADRDDLLHWLGHFKEAPRHLFLTHGEEDAATALAESIKERFGWTVSVPEYGDAVELE